MKTSQGAFVATVVLGMAASAQNEIQHYDGTTETFSRFGVGGGPVTDPQIWYQRLPGDQIGGATGIVSTTAALLDLGPTSRETIRFAIYGDGGGRPGPLIVSSGNVQVSGPGVGQFFLVTIDWTGGTGVPIPLPTSPDCGVPANDLYVAIEDVSGGGLTDGLFIGSSIGTPGEQFNPSTPSDYGSSGTFRYLSYVRNTVNGVLVTIGGNASWWIRLGLSDDLLQPFAFNPVRFTGPSSAGDGQNPNYGYAGIWPDASAGDKIGVRLGSSLPPGGLAVLFYSFSTAPGVFIGFLGGTSCLGSPFFSGGMRPLLVPGAALGSPPPEDFALLTLRAASEAVFGPVAIPAALPPGTRLRMQAVAFSGGARRISTLATVSFP